MELKDLEKEIENIKSRNKRVELDKKWETSLTRKICICVLTYIVVIIYSYLVRNYNNIIWKYRFCFNGLINIAIGTIGTIIGTISIFFKNSSRIIIIAFIVAIFITTIIQLFISKKYKIK